MEPLQQLMELEAIRRLKARYFRLFDTKDWQNWAQVFTPDASLQFDLAVSTRGRDGEPAPALVGRDAIIAYVSRASADDETVHHGHTPEIDFVGENEARGIWAMEDIVDRGDHVIHGFGHYHETYLKQDGEWRIASVHLTRTRLSQTFRGRVAV